MVAPVTQSNWRRWQHSNPFILVRYDRMDVRRRKRDRKVCQWRYCVFRGLLLAFRLFTRTDLFMRLLNRSTRRLIVSTTIVTFPRLVLRRNDGKIPFDNRQVLTCGGVCIRRCHIFGLSSCTSYRAFICSANINFRVFFCTDKNGKLS